MPEVDHTEMRRVLARAVGMSEAEVARIDWPECYWDPERSWADAGRVLEEMRKKPRAIWREFASQCSRCWGNAGYSQMLLYRITPERIAQAAYKALSQEA